MPQDGSCVWSPTGTALGLSVYKARATDTEPLQLMVFLANPSNGTPLVMRDVVLRIETEDGQQHPLTAISRSTRWVDGPSLDPSQVLPAHESALWSFEAPALVRSKLTGKLTLQLSSGDGRQAAADVSLDPCVQCADKCTYTDRDLQNCGACRVRPAPGESMVCSAGSLLCTNAQRACASGTQAERRCVDISLDSTHCGACGVAAPSAGLCLNGVPLGWRPVAVDVGGVTLHTVRGTGPSDIWVGGEQGVTAHWDGGSWTRISTRAQRPVRSIWPNSSRDAWAADVALTHWDGSQWNTWQPPTFGPDARAVWGRSVNDMWAAGDNAKVHHWDGQAWSASPVAESRSFRALWGATSNAFLWAVGQSGMIWHWYGSGWTSQQLATSDNLLAISGNELVGIDMWASSDNGKLWRGGYSGGWREAPTGTTEPLYGVWSINPNDAWAVGGAGTILHLSASGWHAVPSGTTSALRAVWAASSENVWAVGDNGVVLHLSR